MITSRLGMTAIDWAYTNNPHDWSGSTQPSRSGTWKNTIRIALREFCVRHASPTGRCFLAKPAHDGDFPIPVSDRNPRWVTRWIVD